jgi:hypothetical protein
MHDRLAFKEIAFHNTGLYNICYTLILNTLAGAPTNLL